MLTFLTFIANEKKKGFTEHSKLFYVCVVLMGMEVEYTGFSSYVECFTVAYLSKLIYLKYSNIKKKKYQREKAPLQ